jgi:hypothetical protein
MKRAWRLFERWCEANGQPVYPASGATQADAEQVLLRYLHSNVFDRDWSGATVKSSGNYVARTLVDGGYVDPRGLRWSAYVKAARKRKGPQQRISPFTAKQVLALREMLATSSADQQAVEVAAVLVLVDLLALPSSELHSGSSVTRIPRSAFRVRATDLVVEHGTQVIVVDAVRDPVSYRVLHTLLEMAGPDAVMPLRASGQSRYAFTTRLRGAWSRTLGPNSEHLSPGIPHSSTPLIPFRQWWERANDGQREWLIRHTEKPFLRRDVRDAAWFFVALCGGARASEMCTLLVRHQVSSTAEGHLLRLEAGEHKGGRIAITSGGAAAPLEILVPHLVLGGATNVGSEHVGHCPACLLDEHLRVLEADGRVGPDDPLFSNRNGVALNGASSSRIVARLWVGVRHLVAEPDGMRVNTRSLRMTTATLGSAAGLTLVELADLLHHQRLSTTIGYVHMDPVSTGQLVMPYAAPADRGEGERADEVGRLGLWSS